MFSKLLDKIIQNKKTLLIIFIGAFLYFYMSDSVFAATETTTFKDTPKKVAEAIQYISTVIAVFLALITYLTTMFLSPEWINGSLFWLNTVFKSIWVMVSNVVYLIFAFILIWIAFMNIIWKWTEKYALKQALPKFIVGILIVPFSWFLVNFILSISSVLTISALNLPFDTFQAYKTKISTVEVPTNCTLNPDNLSSSWATSTKSKLKSILDCDKKENLSVFLNSEKSWDSIFWVVALYTYWIANIESYDKLSNSYLDITDMAQLIIKIIFDFLFIVVYAILMIALWLVLMTRWIYLWIYMMMSPIFWLMYFFDKTSWWWEFFDKFNLKQFISLAFVPVLAMLALSFGMLFMYMVWNGMTTPPWPNDPPSTIKIEKNTFKINDRISLKIDWSLSKPEWITWFFEKVWNNALGVIWSLILKIFGVVILWWAMMAALRSSDVTKAVVEPLYQFWTKVWEMAKSAPQYAPVFGGQSMSSLSSAASNVKSSFDTTQSQKWLKLAEKFIWWSEKDKKYRWLATNAPANWIGAHKNIQDILAVWDSKDISSSSDAIKWLSVNIQKMIDDKLIENNEAVKWAMEKLKNWLWKPQDIREALAILDTNSKDDRYSILWWAHRVNDAAQVDNYTWNNASKNSQTPWTPVAWTQTINLTIKNWTNSNVPITLNNVSLTDEQKTKISSIDIANINTKKDIIDELKKINWLTDEIIENIIKAIDPTWSKFK